MKTNGFILGLILLVIGGCLWSSCTKNDDNTIALIGTEYYIDDIVTVIPDSLRPKFMAEFGSIPEGPVPPKIEGEYVVDPKLRIGSNLDGWPLQVTEPNVYLRFTGQHNGVVAMDLNETTENLTDTVFVCGNGNAFAVYFVEDKRYEMPMEGQVFHVRVKRGIVLKGVVTETGLSDFRYATIIMETEDDSNGIIGQYPNGSYFIYKDGDGNAKRFDW